MDIVYLFKHSKNQDFELRQSLRSVDQYAPHIRKVWIFGDRPSFIANNKSLIEHVPHEYTARFLGVKTPVTNFFLLTVLSSLIPDLSFEYLRFSDDFFLLNDFPVEEARRDRYLEDLTAETPLPRGRGTWKESLWRTRDLLVRLGYTAYNFEVHTPMYLTRKRVLEAYCDFRDFITEERWYGPMAVTAILNHALKQESNDPSRPELISLKAEGSRGGFWGKPPASNEELLDQVRDRRFFNFDDDAFGPIIVSFLEERYPRRSKFEKH
jgi:hypothetical protein